jgi:tryptophanyl-tRNA synthetase
MAHRLVSGIQATGTPHIGNYFGAIRQMVQLQEKYENFILVADLHSLNQIHDADRLRSGTREIVINYLASGLDPEKTTIFLQSSVPAHAELSTILGSITSLGLLERAHAYKDALAKGREANLGLFSYPVLMAADILLYKPEVVPVGRDQQQHLEITNDIASRFNHLYGQTFSLPKGIILDEVATVPGIDGQKMSKSYSNTIGLFESPEVVKEKVMKIPTDSRRPEEPKEVDTLLALHRLISAADLPEIEEAYVKGGMGYKETKERLAANITSFLQPFHDRLAEINTKPGYLEDILVEGNKQANIQSNATLEEVKERVGILSL